MGMQRPLRLQKPGPQWSFGTKRSIVGGTTSGHAPLTRNSSLNPSLFSRQEPLQVSQCSCCYIYLFITGFIVFNIFKKSHLQIPVMPKKWNCLNKKKLQLFADSKTTSDQNSVRTIASATLKPLQFECYRYGM